MIAEKVVKAVIDSLMDKIKRTDWKYKNQIPGIGNIGKKDWHIQKAKIRAASEVRGFRKHLSQNFWTLAISTFGIANGLVWYDVWNTIVNEFFPVRNTLALKIYAAIIITFIFVIATYVITKVRDRNGTS